MTQQLHDPEIEGRGMCIRRDDSSTEEVERAQVKGAKGANGGPPHIHRFQEERFIVHTGALTVRRGRERITVGAGGEIRIPPKVIHTFQAETASTYTVEFRPALRIEEFFRDLFALPTDRRGNPRIGDAARLMRAYPDEFLYLPFVPVPVQRALAVPLSKLGSARR
ncbi:MAG TPA: cupin domain-containing protein [Solirubrobacteraceae bacterium]|nr:cupin domain-containing protein [Solirubrobacteraceae bacterium]